ncbi:MAG TPA: acyl carrier protein [Thermoanaerobaculia bacterium]
MTKQAIREFIATNFYVADASWLEDDEASLTGAGIVDSTGMLEVIAFVERTLGIPVADEDLLPENFDSVGRIAAFVERKKRAAA